MTRMARIDTKRRSCLSMCHRGAMDGNDGGCTAGVIVSHALAMSRETAEVQPGGRSRGGQLGSG